jgi:hypothetical protein
VFWARAIVGSYGAIEELGLEVRASKETPALLPNGEWNPVVLHNLKARLEKRRVNVAERITWTMRGSKRTIEKKLSGRLLQPTTEAWARGPIRDMKVDLVDAINAASFLRSRVAAHRGSELRERLSPIDVHNCQMVARRLVMESFREWRRV